MSVETRLLPNENFPLALRLPHGLDRPFRSHGVTSLIRALGLKEILYDRLLDFFHSTALDPGNLVRLWTSVLLKIHPSILRTNGRLLIAGDGIKAPKSGKKMPAVKLFHQASESNTKPTYIPFFIGPGQWEQLAGWNRCPLGVPR